MTKTELIKEVLDLLLEDENEDIPVHRINKYINEVLNELKFCKITYKSVDEISLHEFKTRDGFVLLVRVIYNGDFEHNFSIYGGK